MRQALAFMLISLVSLHLLHYILCLHSSLLQINIFLCHRSTHFHFFVMGMGFNIATRSLPLLHQMSSIFSLILLLGFFLGFSVHACDARTLKESDEKPNPSGRVWILSRGTLEFQDDDEAKRWKDELKSESVASVRWRVPRRKKGEEEAGYNLDYLPPRTHPPVHN